MVEAACLLKVWLESVRGSGLLVSVMVDAGALWCDERGARMKDATVSSSQQTFCVVVCVVVCLIVSGVVRLCVCVRGWVFCLWRFVLTLVDGLG